MSRSRGLLVWKKDKQQKQQISGGGYTVKRKTELKKKTPLKQTAKKRPKQTIPDLTKKADTALSRYVRLRDSSYTDAGWLGRCITCDKELTVLSAAGKWRAGANLGHFIGRGCKELRYDEFNTNLQCAWCNAWRDKEDMLQAYRKGIVDKYGDRTLKELKERAKITRTNSREELEQIIHDSKLELQHMLDNPTYYSK